MWIEEFAAKIKVFGAAWQGSCCSSTRAIPARWALGAHGRSWTPDVLRDALNSNNVTVLTSSDKDELSREDRRLGAPADFTKAFLDALAGGADPPNSRENNFDR